jgi:hypothetical protein
MSTAEEIERKIIETVIAAEKHRLRPCEITDSVSQQLGVPTSNVKEAMDELIKKRKLFCAYGDPCMYLGIPLKNWPRESCPVKVVVNGKGNPWICHSDVDPSQDLAKQGAWRIDRED